MTNTEKKLKKKMNERLRDIKGITLISLVITVIILLILAAVAINLAVDSNGLFKKTGDAANSWNTSVAEEERILNELLDYGNPVGSYVTETSTVAGVEKERTAPIPKGYVASQIPEESTIAEGLVIYEGTAEVAGTKGSAEHETAMTTRNQYVWIPVDDINDMIMCSVCGGASRKLVYDEETKTLACTNTHEEDAEPKLVGKLYEGTSSHTTDADDNYIYTYTMDFTKNDQTYDTNSGYREPAVVTDYDESSNNYHGLGTESTFLAQLQSDFDNMAQSVAKYKGFYISRYEIGANGASKKGQPVMTAADNSQMWYGLYSTIRKTGSSTTSQMIWRKPV